MKLAKIFLSLISFCTLTSAYAAENSPVLFQAWKNQQILEAQNQVLKASARLAKLKQGKNALTASTFLATSKVKSSNPMVSAEKDLKRFQDSLANAQELTFTDYVSIYVVTLQEDPEMVAKLAERLTRDELAEAFKCLMQQTPRADAKHNNTLLGSLGPSIR